MSKFSCQNPVTYRYFELDWIDHNVGSISNLLYSFKTLNGVIQETEKDGLKRREI